MKFYNYLIERKKMKETMIGLGINEYTLGNLVSYMEAWLDEQNIEFKHIEEKHISLAMLPDNISKDELVRVVHKIPSKLSLPARKLQFFSGRDFDFIVVELQKTPELQNLRDEMESKYNLVQFKTGFKPHVSLFKVRKNTIKKIMLTDVFSNAPMPSKVQTDKVELWSKKFQIEYEKRT